MKIIVLSSILTTFDTSFIDREIGDAKVRNYSFTIIDPNTYANLTKLIEHFTDLIESTDLCIVLDTTSVKHLNYLKNSFPSLTFYKTC